MRTKELKQFVLSSFGAREFYGYEVHKALELQGNRIGTSRLYSILDEMKKASLLKDRWEKSESGPKKRVYFLTPMGKAEREKLLLEAIDIVHDFYLEYLLTLPPEKDVFRKVSSLVSDGLKKNARIACIASKPSVQLEKVLANIRTRIPDGPAYVINPSYSEKEFSIDGWLPVDGSHGSIPLKDGYLDLLLVVGFPPINAIDHCIVEWHRVLKSAGTLNIITPTILIEEYPDPLMIGMFVEAIEHGMVPDEKRIDSESIRMKLGSYFEGVEEHRVVHMTLFQIAGPLPIHTEMKN
ncbi:MAG: PadR family transcriptional regulator [Promethearchaeota archaeon]